MNVRFDMITVFVVRQGEADGPHEFLQLHRAAHDYLGGTWQVVRGGLEPGENAVQGGLRELREEAGLVPQEFFRLGMVESFYTAVDDTLWHSVAFCALVRRDQPVILNEEHDDLRWIPRERFRAACMWASERNLLDELFTQILDGGPARPHLRIEV